MRKNKKRAVSTAQYQLEPLYLHFLQFTGENTMFQTWQTAF